MTTAQRAIPFNSLKPQHDALREQLVTAATRVIDSGWFILGEEVAAFEAEFAAKVGATHAVGVASGTDAIQLALMAAGVTAGDEVITSAFTAVPTVTAIERTGARPVFADIDPSTFTLDPACVEPVITSRTRAILPVHLYGHPADLDPLLELAARKGLVVIDDAAQAFGARYKGRRVGSAAPLTAFSFYPTKNLGACGDGGAVTTSDPELAERLRMMREYGQRTRYLSEIEGINSRLDELQAALLRAKLPYVDAWRAARATRAAAYARELREVVAPSSRPWADHAWHLYVVRSERRDALQAFLRSRGTGTRIHYPVPVHLQPAFRHLGLGPGSLPLTERLSREIVSLPLYPELSLDDIAFVAAQVNAFGAGS